MSSPEIPNQPEKSPLEILSQKAQEAILKNENKEGELGEEALVALIAWQEVAEQIADIENTSIATTEVMVSRAQLFLDANRPDLALADLKDALLAAENDFSFPPERLEALRSMKRRLTIA